MRDHEKEKQIANDLYNDFCRSPWNTGPERPTGVAGYCEPNSQQEPDSNKEQGQLA